MEEVRHWGSAFGSQSPTASLFSFLTLPCGCPGTWKKNLLMDTSQRSDPPSPSSYQLPIVPWLVVGPRSPTPTFSGTSGGLIVCRSYSCKHSGCEFVDVIAIPCPEESISQRPRPSLSSEGLCLFCLLFSSVP